MKENIRKDYGLDEKVVLYQLVFHCELMYDYLTETGKQVPEWIGNTLSTINLKVASIKNHILKHEMNQHAAPKTKWLQWKKKWELKKLKEEKEKHVELELHTKIAQAVKGDRKQLTQMLNELSALCAPSTPCTLENTIPTHKIFVFFGQKTIRFLRDLGSISITCLAGYIFCGWWSSTLPNGVVPFQMLLLFSAGLGACFYSLNTAKKYVVNRTFDNKFIAHYYNRILIGIIAGFILANIIDSSFLQLQKETGVIARITPSLISLLGGFSSDVVVRILNRLLAMLTTLVEGEAKDIIESRLQEVKNKMNAEMIKKNLISVSDLYSVLESSPVKTNPKTYDTIKNVIDKLIEVK